MCICVCVCFLSRGAIHRQNGSYNNAVDDFLLAMNKCGHQYDNEVYKQASRQLVLTYNDFAVECFRYTINLSVCLFILLFL